MNMSDSTASSTNPKSVAGDLDPFKLGPSLDASFLPGRPTCISISHDNEYIFVGGDTGQVNLYSFKPTLTNRNQQQNNTKPLSLVNSKRISKKAIRQLHLLEPLDPSSTRPFSISSSFLFLLTSDGRLLACHPLTLTIVIDFASTVSSSSILFAIDPMPPHHIAVGYKNKKKLTLHSFHYESKSAIGQNSIVRELAIPDFPTALSYCGEWLCFSTRRSYSLIHTGSSQLRELPVPLASDSLPSIHVLSASELLLTASNDLALFVDSRGEPLPSQPIDWKRPVLASMKCEQYIVGVLNGEGIKVASLLEGGRIVQTIGVSKPVAAVATPSFGGSTSSASSTDDESRKVIAVITPSSLLILSLASLNEQIQQYMHASLTDLALQLLLRTQPSPSELAEFHTQAGFVLLCDGLQLAQAFHHFAISSVDPRELLVLFRDLEVKQVQYRPTQMQYIERLLGGEGGRTTQIEIGDVIERGRRLAMAADNKKYKGIVGLSVRQLTRQCRLQLAIFLWNKRSNIQQSKDVEMILWVDTALLMLVVELKEAREVGATTGGGGGDRAMSTIEGREGESSSTTPALAATVTTSASVSALFPFTLRQLLFPSNACLLSECEPYLLSMRYYQALALLYQSKGNLRQALQVWMKMSSGEYKTGGGEGTQTGGTRTSTTSTTSTTQSANAAAMLDGITESVNLLSTLSDQPLLWEFSEWILLKKPTLGLKIFTSANRVKGGSEALAPEKVLRFLKSVCKKSDPFLMALRGEGEGEGEEERTGTSGGKGGSGTAQPVDLVESYLEFLVHSEPTCDSQYHTQLALTYLDKVLLYSALPSRNTQYERSPSSPNSTPDVQALRLALQQQNNGKGLERPKLGSEPGHLGAMRLKLFQFVQASHLVDFQAVLQKLLSVTWPYLSSSSSSIHHRSPSSVPLDSSSSSLPSLPSALTLSSFLIDSFRPSSLPYEELILLYSKLNAHAQVLRIYVYGLRDENGAAAYCRDVAMREVRAIVRRGREEKERVKEKAAAAAAAGGTVGEGGMEETELSGSRRNTLVGEDPHLNESLSSSSSSADTLPHPGDVFLHLLDLYLSDEYLQLFGQLQPTSTKGA